MDKSFTVVIPTMWKYPPIHKFIEDLTKLDVVTQILVIDNDVQARWGLGGAKWRLSSKVDLIGDPNNRWALWQNIGCNAAWNLGVSQSQNENICIMNDDIIFDIRAFYRAADALSDEKPLLGMSAGDVIHGQPPIIDGAIDIMQWKPGMHTHGFGCLFFVRKSWWIPIPEKLWLYYGDNWVFDTTLKRNKPVHLLTNFMYNTPFAVTTSKVGSDELLRKEHAIYYEALKNL